MNDVFAWYRNGFECHEKSIVCEGFVSQFLSHLFSLQFVHEAWQYSVLDRDEEISQGNHSMDHVLQAFGNWAAFGLSQITRSYYNMVVSGYLW